MLPTTDQHVLREQMGRTPRDVAAVAVRCHDGHPCVVTSYPLRRAKGRVVPFPTLYWLSCPRLCSAVACLERDGVIAAISDELARDAVLRAALRRDHERYIADRWAMLSAEDQSLVAEIGMQDYFNTRGIGGMTNHAAVKCLHLHLAHHLASGNVLGELLVQRYGLRPCM